MYSVYSMYSMVADLWNSFAKEQLKPSTFKKFFLKYEDLGFWQSNLKKDWGTFMASCKSLIKIKGIKNPTAHFSAFWLKMNVDSIFRDSFWFSSMEIYTRNMKNRQITLAFYKLQIFKLIMFIQRFFANMLTVFMTLVPFLFASILKRHSQWSQSWFREAQF